MSDLNLNTFKLHKAKLHLKNREGRKKDGRKEGKYFVHELLKINVRPSDLGY